MSHDFLIRTTNRIAIYATAALIYWAFIFVLITVFDLKIFRERMTESFFLSLLAIFAILGGALVLNVMSNLSKISFSVAVAKGAAIEEGKSFRRVLVAVGLSFPLIAAILFAGNELSAQRRESLLVNSARKLVAENQEWLAAMSNYSFSKDYVKRTEGALEVLKKIDKDLPEVLLIVPDQIDGKKLFLSFGDRHHYGNEEKIEKPTYIYSASKDEREYLEKIYSGDTLTNRFRAEKGNYQLYFPTVVAGRKIVLYFSDYQRYGKFGS